MKRQQFRLESILELRARALEDAENALRRAIAELEKLRVLREETRALANTLADSVCLNSQPQTASTLESTRQAYVGKMREIENISTQMEARNVQVQGCRQRLVEASRNHEILLRLKDKWRKSVDYEDARKEEGLLNDIINARRFHHQRENDIAIQEN